MKIHFIAIGGSAMHNLAIALQKKGYTITGSDDEIFEPSYSRLARYNLLPTKNGWDKKNIHKNLDAIILGMHAKDDNPELIRARELNLKIFSYPEFLYEQAKDKTRIVIGGSHGKTTITALILHVLQHHGIDTDYMVGAQLEGFDVMVKLSEKAPFMIFEGDEYLSSTLDKRPKFHIYKPHIALLSGIAWDHINVFPTFENYVDQFRKFIELIEENGKLIFCSDDPTLASLCAEEDIRPDICRYPYTLPEFAINNNKTFLRHDGVVYPLHIFGNHNLLNVSGAMNVCRQLGISDTMFMEAIVSFKGASNRLQLVAENDSVVIFKDFAHAPSKLMATIKAVKEQYQNRKLLAVMELHTYSSLNKEFLKEYKDTMKDADEPIVFYNPHAISLKRLPEITQQEIQTAFNQENLVITNNAEQLEKLILQTKDKNRAYLFMSSGNFGNLNINQMALSLLGSKK